MRFILWLYVTLGNGQQCNYERVGLFADRDSLHIVSQSIDLHLRKEKKRLEEIYVLSNGHKDSLYSVQMKTDSDGLIVFITHIKKRETIIISHKPCHPKHIRRGQELSMKEW